MHEMSLAGGVLDGAGGERRIRPPAALAALDRSHGVAGAFEIGQDRGRVGPVLQISFLTADADQPRGSGSSSSPTASEQSNRATER